ncbi:MAG TPA: tetratricopeptide repeat protein [Burkholderiaceae bacterium]|jgi:hypothetical protein|nr:tetratricopeptide repeat protein [Burkholderiaceae bacterium]
MPTTPCPRTHALLPAWRWLAALWLAAFAMAAQAQTIDDVQLLAQGDDMVARVTFNATVRFLQQSPTTPATLYQIGWELVAADEAVVNQSTDESRRIAAQGSVPEITLTYAVAKGKRAKTLTLELGAAAAVSTRQGPSSRSIDIVFAGLAGAAPAAPAGATATAPPPAGAASAVVASPEIEAQAAPLLERARAALAARQNEDAVTALNQLLLLPPNSSSQQAQELVGVVWERLGNTDRARTEYELYLRLYPQGEGADRVRQRLATLTGEAVAAAPAGQAASGAEPAAAKPATARNRFNGNIAQYYYGGKARTQSLVNLPAGIDQSTLSQTTESAIVTSVDVGARFEGTDSDTRAVLRGTNSINLSSASHAQSLLSAAYVDYKRNESGLSLRVGRQSAISGGLLGLFDGASLTYPVSQGWKFDLMGGAPSNPLVNAPQERMAAAMVEADGLLDHWGGDAYVIDQTTQGITNRRALGVEVRYSGDTFSTYTLLDYDLLFHKLNAFSLQGSAQVPGQTTVTLLVDSRNAPSLDLTNALISTGATSLKQLLQTQSLAQVRADAIATTARARQALLSASRPINQSWQLAVDLRYSEVGATPAVGNFEAMPATGAQYGTTLQLTGSNLYSKHDISNFNLSLLHAPTFKGTQVSYGNLSAFSNNDFTLEPTLTYYQQHDNMDVHLHRAGLGLRGTWRLSRRASMLGEGVYEHTHTEAPLNHDTTNSIFFYVGYRYDLF